uniref:ATP synthase F0 subunit 8 n=1 Tax=Pseudagkistrodon rudis TaxID=2759634 RepID=A0A7T6ZQV8_9SAUR|nr:ATP synthase F0 subunit 8 [Pseudagkistrodon rudis]QQK90411.1 ATP synthase F0 subunit 8 [Pseudagkistrodon rudis]QYC94121.1 ATP synthase F0 subunit 8 [Pseudagkistrodon rudis]
MPQLDTIFISTIFLWTWMMLILLMKKIVSMSMVSPPKNLSYMKFNKQTLTLPWT